MSPEGRHSGELPLPLYGLVGQYGGDRFIDGEGWDLLTVVHRSDKGQGDLVVGVDRRTTARYARDAPRVAISDELARESMATALVVNLPSVGDEIFEIAAEVARDDDAWKRREVKLDGEVIAGHEREYADL